MDGTLKQWRRWRDMTQTDLAEAVGKSYPTIRHWETGKTSPRVDDLEKLRKVLALKESDNIILP